MTTPLTDADIAQMWVDLSARASIEPTDVPRLIREVEASRAKLAAIRELHRETTSLFRPYGGEPRNVCACCQFYWPCPTTQRLDGAT